MSRSLKKGPYVDERVLAKVIKAKQIKSRAPIKTWSRACVISPEMVGVTFLVHNGKDFLTVFAEENMVGHRLGEFAPTRKFVRHGGKMAKEQETAAAEAGASAGAPVKGAPAKAGPKK
ncbi:30S ribosomal protein S19 [Patescibacteria group bacterium]|nr:MAG: 30S ribosomal protein S19 [Patescibacteria group bacterium]